MEKTSFNYQSVMFKEGLPADKLFIIKSGEVLCLKSANDRLIPIFLAKEGDIIGESAMMEKLDYTYSAISTSKVEVLEIPSSNFDQVFKMAPNWLKELLTTMIIRFQNTSNLVAQNRIVHSSVIDEDQFTPQTETVFKKLLASKIE